QALMDDTQSSSFQNFSPFPTVGTPAKNDACPILPTAAAPRPATAVVDITPAPGTIVRPGDLVPITLAITGGNPVAGAVFGGAGRADVVNGPGPFASALQVPDYRAGTIEITGITFGPGPDNYTASTYVVIQRADAPTSISATPSSLSFF